MSYKGIIKRLSIAYLLRSLNGLDFYTSEEGLYIASVVPLKTTLDGNTSYSINPTKNIVFVKFFPSNQFGVASMERIGVVQIGHNPGGKYFRDLGDPYKLYMDTTDNSKYNANYITWWGSDEKPVEIYKPK